MANLEQNKALVRQFFAEFSSGNIDRTLALMSDDGTWWTPSGAHGKEPMRGVLQFLFSHLKNGLAFTVGTMTAEDDRVAVEVQSHGDLKNGRVYANKYHFLMRINNGKIAEAREHCDTQHATETWADLFATMGQK